MGSQWDGNGDGDIPDWVMGAFLLTCAAVAVWAIVSEGK